MTGEDHQQLRRHMYNRNRLKIGLFGANCSSGRAVTQVAERWSGDWDDNLKMAQIADAAGIDFLLPVARWKGYGGDTDYQGATLETITWATALLASTRQITVFGTVHAPMFHPVIAAKQFVTADRVGKGRFGLNMVVGWNQDEFDMFGVTQRDHDARYAYGEEWLRAVRMIWSDAEDFDFDGQYIKLKNVRGKPKPWGDSLPLTMNAGTSPAGQEFALRHCDALFTNPPREELHRGLLEATRNHVAAVKKQANDYGREIDVYSVGVVTCRPTRQEAHDYYHHCIVENADWSAVDCILAKRKISEASVGREKFEQHRKHTANGMGGLPIIGDADDVANQLAQLSEAGLRGVGISFINYAQELPFFCSEVLPRLARMGIREPASKVEPA
jgi:dimethylsulfone monooxygenase